jgi:prolyl oligopeptidase
VARQAELAETVLAGCPDRENLRREMTRLFDHPRYGAPFRRGDKYFYFHNSGLQAQKVLYMQVRSFGFRHFPIDLYWLSCESIWSG